ncbi:MAG: DUF4177 domain-containing protein [Pseudomonadota bacterium]
MSTRWSYKVVEVKPQWLGVKAKQVEETLVQLGMQGWELVSVVQNGLNVLLYLKKGN